MIHSNHVELGDLLIEDTGILGKLVYRVTNDFLHIKLQNIDNGFEHDKCFRNLGELEEFIKSESDSITLIPLHWLEVKDLEKVSVSIETCNSAFDENGHLELSRILIGLAENIANNNKPSKLLDINGNVVGTVKYE